MSRYAYQRKDKSPTAWAWLLLVFLWCATIFVIWQIVSFVLSPTQTVADISANMPQLTAAPTQEPQHASAISYSISGVDMLELGGNEPKILIYHTHTTEAYVDAEGWRTNDDENNVVAVGERLKECLEQNYGFNVIHDTTQHEYPKLSTSYDRSVLTIQSYLDKYPSIELVIDLHRDSYNVTDEPTTDYADVYDAQAARIMFVVGRGTNYEDKPDFDKNYAFAELILEKLETIRPRLVRPIRVKDGRYNQHLCNYSLLVEVGHNANTLEQAINSMPYLAEAIALASASLRPQETFPSSLSCFVPLD